MSDDLIGRLHAAAVDAETSDNVALAAILDEAATRLATPPGDAVAQLYGRPYAAPVEDEWRPITDPPPAGFVLWVEWIEPWSGAAKRGLVYSQKAPDGVSSPFWFTQEQGVFFANFSRWAPAIAAPSTRLATATATATATPPGDAVALDNAIAAYNAVWQAWPNMHAGNVDECRREAMRAALSTIPERAHGEQMREAAARVADTFAHDPDDSEFDRGYSTAAASIASVIRALPLTLPPAEERT